MWYISPVAVACTSSHLNNSLTQITNLGRDWGGYLSGFVLCTAATTGLDHQTLENVDPTDSDKRVELGLYLLSQQTIGVEKTGANSNICRLDKREDHHFCGLPGNFSGG